MEVSELVLMACRGMVSEGRRSFVLAPMSSTSWSSSSTIFPLRWLDQSTSGLERTRERHLLFMLSDSRNALRYHLMRDSSKRSDAFHTDSLEQEPAVCFGMWQCRKDSGGCSEI